MEVNGAEHLKCSSETAQPLLWTIVQSPVNTCSVVPRQTLGRPLIVHFLHLSAVRFGTETPESVLNWRWVVFFALSHWLSATPLTVQQGNFLMLFTLTIYVGVSGEACRQRRSVCVCRCVSWSTGFQPSSVEAHSTSPYRLWSFLHNKHKTDTKAWSVISFRLTSV